MDLAKRRSNSVVVRIWAGYRGSEYFNLLEWRVDLCCLRYIGKDLRDLPAGLPNNTILFGFESGFYTAPDEDDMLDHPHTTAQEPIASIPGVSLKRSYTYECVMRLNNLHECIADTRESRNEIKRNIEAALVKENAPMILVIEPLWMHRMRWSTIFRVLRPITEPSFLDPCAIAILNYASTCF